MKRFNNENYSLNKRDIFKKTITPKRSYYDPAIEARYKRIVRLRAELAKIEAKPISSVVHLNQKAVLSEVQTRITIGCDLACNLQINDPRYIASVHCILSIRRMNKHYIKELDFETMIKNGWNNRTLVNGIPLEPNEERILKHDDKILVKSQENFFEVRFFEDAKVDFENQFKATENRLPARLAEKYHVVNNEDGNYGHNKIGSSCIVKKIRSNFIYDDNIYAAKIINVSDGKFDYDRVIKYKNEIEILKNLDHENIVKLVGEYVDKENIIIILPYLCESLETYIKTLNGFIGIKLWKTLAFQICSAIKYIHENHVMHRDIKPDNIMFTDSNFNQVKLIDFGESKRIEGSYDSMGNYIEHTNTDLVGSPLYVAPELARAFKNRILMFTTEGDADSNTAQCEYDKSIDIWSFGIVNYYILSQKYPWSVNNHERVKGEGKQSDYNELYGNIMEGIQDFSTFKSIRSDIEEIETVVDFIFKLCQVDRDQRMTPDQALQHMIFN